MIVPGSPNALLLAQSADPLDEMGKVDRSLRFRASSSAHLKRVIGAIGDRRRWTFNTWVKIQPGQYGTLLFVTDISTQGSAYYFWIYIKNTGELIFQDVSPGYVNETDVKTAALFKDATGHFNIHFIFDSLNATQSERCRLYINGSRTSLIPGVSGGTLPEQNSYSEVSTAQTHYIGTSYFGTPSWQFDGYLSDVCLVDGKALEPTNFGQFHPRTGQWRPKSKAAIRATVAVGGGVRNGWGANGFFLPFDDVSSATALGYDRSQSDTDTTGNNWTPANISLTSGATYDSSLDTPTNNFCTWNPLVTSTNNGGSLAFSEGNLRAYVGGYANTAVGSIGVSSGKWYWEVSPQIITGTNAFYVGVVADGYNTGAQPSADALQWAYYGASGNKMNGGSVAYGAAFTTGDIIGVALDCDNGTLEFFKNGVSQGIAFANLAAKRIYPSFSAGDIYSVYGIGNFGQRPFSHTPPSGFKTLCTKNLPLSGGTVTVSGTFVGNASADGRCIFCNGAPETLTINGNPVTWGTHADRLATGFKLRTASASYNSTGTNTWTATVLTPLIQSTFRYQNAKGNP